VRTLYQRWLEKVAIPADESGCWVWCGATTNGYGVIRRGRRGRGLIRAHVFAYTHFVGPVPPGLELRHRCHVRHCVNPDHLIPGTRLDNIRDMIDAGRREWHGLRGEANPLHKLTDEQVRAIRGDQRVLREIASDYGVSSAVISTVRRRESWTHVKEP
jgi:hypothetical protein